MENTLRLLVSVFVLLPRFSPASAFFVLKKANGRARYRLADGPIQPWRSTTIESEEGVMPSLARKSSFDWIKQWYPVVPVSYLEQAEQQLKPTKVTVLGIQLAIWNSASTGSNSTYSWSIFEDVCPHRRSLLSTGQVVPGGKSSCSTLRCRYHGWEFDAQGQCSKMPNALPVTTNTELETKRDGRSFEAIAFPSRVRGGLLWVYLDREGGVNASQLILPDIPSEVIPLDEEILDTNWMFNVNPVSYISMMENTFDPAHAPFTHEGMTGFANIAFSPHDVLPMKRYEVAAHSDKGFVLEHSPYQRSTAKAGGEDKMTRRSFTPPCTVSVASPPFFETKMWFVPSTLENTNVISFFKTRNTRILKSTKRFPRLHRLLEDSAHFSTYIGNWNYRFLSQDRITMQGQEERKTIDGEDHWMDPYPTPSDTGVATFQRWIRDFGGMGPFSRLYPNLRTHREMSMWESHGKYCPQCQRSAARVAAVKQIASKVYSWSLLFAVLLGGAAVASSRIAGRQSLCSGLSLASLLFAMTSRWLVDRTRRIQRRVFAKGDDSWQQTVEIFGRPMIT